jgi:hypothetical protein
MRAAAIMTLFATALGVGNAVGPVVGPPPTGDEAMAEHAGEGAGGDLLDPWLACTREGQKLVRDRYDRDEDRVLTEATAEEANIWFRRYADQNRDMRLTDQEIKAALVTHVRFTRRGRY